MHRRLLRSWAIGIGVMTSAVLLAAPASAGVLPGSADPAPGPGGCSVDIVNREAGSYSAGRVHFTYDLAAPSCRTALYGLIVLNNDNHKQVALYLQPGHGDGTRITYDVTLPFTPTNDPTADDTYVPGAGLCVIGFTELNGKIADVAPDQATDLQTILTAPSCSPLFPSGAPIHTARAFH